MIYICIPALDEARTIGVLLWRIRQVMAEFPRDYELIVLDDGSTDGTEEVLAPYARVLPLTVLRNARTEGYARSLERLIREAVSRSRYPKRDVVVTLQGDFTEAPEDIPRLVKRIEGGADLVGSSQTTPTGELPRATRWAHRLLPWLFRRRALPEAITDPLSGFRAYRVIVLKRALAECGEKPLLSRSGWAANAELLLAVAPHLRRAEGAEIELRYDRRQRPTRFDAWRTLKDSWGLARRTPRASPPLPAASET